MTADRQRTKVADLNEFEGDTSRIIVEVDGMEIAIIQQSEEYYAVANFCPHQSGPLCEGSIQGRMELDSDGWGWQYTDEGEYVTCPWHAWKFSIKTGDHVDDDRYRVPTYEATVENGEIFVEK